MLNKKVIFVGGADDGCYHYRCRLPSNFLKQTNSIGYFEDSKDRDDADVVVLQRATHEFFLTEIPKLQAQGKKVIYDIDDNLWDIPATNPASHIYRTQALKLAKSIMKLCDAVTVSTQPLKDYFDGDGYFNDKVYVIPNFIEDIFPERETDDDIVTIGFCGTVTHKGDFNYRLIRALDNLKKDSNVRLVCVGLEILKGKNDLYIPWIKTDEYAESVYNLGIDIALAPLDNIEFNRCKSNLKWLESASMGSCFVGSNVYPYTNSINNYETGVIVENDRNWEKALRDLIDNNKDRKYIQRTAREYVKSNYTYKYNGEAIARLYNEVFESIK